jgi:hypothetical protein
MYTTTNNGVVDNRVSKRELTRLSERKPTRSFLDHISGREEKDWVRHQERRMTDSF